MKPIHFEICETAVTIVSEEKYHKVAKEAIFDARGIIEKKISDDPFFGITYDPYQAEKDDDPLIVRMCVASQSAGVGPMASVAGAVASYAIEKMVESGSDYAIVENGGDIAISADRDVNIGLFSDNPKFRDLALHIPARKGIFGVCTSSGRIGPSVSFGSSNLSTVISDDVLLADACATALGNLVRDSDSNSLSDAVERIAGIEGVECCLVISGDYMASCGDVPEIIRCESKMKAAGIVYQKS